MSLIRHRLQSRSILLIDFLCPYDSIKAGGRSHQMHTGYIARNDARRGFDSCGCLGDLTEKALEVLTDAFTEQREVPEYRDRDLNYEALCEVMQGVSHKSESFRTGALQLAERYVVLYDQLRDPIYNHSFSQSFDDLPLARQPLSSLGERRFQSLKRAVMHTIFADRISARELLGDFDPYLNTSVSWMKKGTQRTPMINMSSGCISRSQFLRGMHRLAGRMDLQEEDLNLIFNKYKKNGAFNYYAFCRDVDPGFDELQVSQLHVGTQAVSHSKLEPSVASNPKLSHAVQI